MRCPARHAVWTLVAGFLAVAVLAVVASPAAASAQFAAARAAYVSGRYAAAVADLRAHLAQHPRDAAAWMWLGAAHYQLGQLEEAARSFTWAVKLAPSPEHQLWLGAAYARLGRAAEARAAFTAAGRSRLPQTALIAQQWLRGLSGQSVPVLARPERQEAYAYVVRWYNPRLSAAQVDAIVRSVVAYSYRYDVDSRLVMALIAVESGFRVTAKSPAGALGLGQLMPATARSLGVNPLDPVANIQGTVRWLRGLLERSGNDYSLALAAYNAGRGAVVRYSGIPPYNETQWYVYNVLTLYRHLTGG